LTRRSKTKAEATHAKVLGSTAGELESMPDAKWSALEKRAAILRSAGDDGMTRATAERAARVLGVHPTTVYRWRKRLLEAGIVTALEDRKRGFPGGQGRLSHEQECVIGEVIEASLQRGAFVRGVDLVEEIGRRCVRGGLQIPSRRAVERRWKRAQEARAAGSAAPGSFGVSNPLDVVQIDHTVSDVMVVDDLYRQPIGRPYLTVALDVATRSVLAAMLSFDAPSAATVALCLMRIANPKANWLTGLDLQIDWPMAGLPRSLHLDNAPEFHSKALARGCAQFGIELIYRPAGRPHFGGHIERSIGTLMSRFKTLPGATGSCWPIARQSNLAEGALPRLFNGFRRHHPRLRAPVTSRPQRLKRTTIEIPPPRPLRPD
jgi:putative transposase